MVLGEYKQVVCFREKSKLSRNKSIRLGENRPDRPLKHLAAMRIGIILVVDLVIAIPFTGNVIGSFLPQSNDMEANVSLCNQILESYQLAERPSLSN